MIRAATQRWRPFFRFLPSQVVEASREGSVHDPEVMVTWAKTANPPSHLVDYLSLATTSFFVMANIPLPPDTVNAWYFSCICRATMSPITAVG